MASPIPPSRESEFVPWLTNLHTLVAAEVGNFGVPSGTMSSFTSLFNAYISAYETATTPSTRTAPSIQAKADSAEALMPVLYEVMRVIQAMPTVTNEQRAELGLRIRDVEPSPVPVPDTAPVVEIASMNGWLARLRLREAGSERRGKPTGVIGANIYTFTGAEPPTELTDWVFEGETTRTIFDVQFPGTLAAGTKVWVTACWKNPRFQVGPASTPISMLVGGGITSIAA